MEASMKHVLLVEDEEAHAELIQLSFELRDDIQLVVATSLEEARGRLAQSMPDLLIIDSMLPDGRGVELLEARPTDTSCPIILLTSHAGQNDAGRSHGRRCGTIRRQVGSDSSRDATDC